MKRQAMKALLAALLCGSVILAAGCGKKNSASEVSAASAAASASAESGKWSDAKYTEDAEIGEGAHTALVDVTIDGKTVTLTVKSDKDNLADILVENGIAEGDNSEYGLYIKKVNGVRADYDADKAYWALNINGEAAMTGASGVTVKDGERYELAYTPA